MYAYIYILNHTLSPSYDSKPKAIDDNSRNKNTWSRRSLSPLSVLDNKHSIPSSTKLAMPVALPLVPLLTDDCLFPIIGCVLPAWALLCIAPRWKWTRRTAAFSLVIISLLQMLLAASPIKKYGLTGLIESIFTYPGVVGLLKEAGSLLIWAHLAAADLAAALWMLSDSQTRSISHILMIPQLMLTFLSLLLGFCFFCWFSVRFAAARVNPRACLALHGRWID